jgi:hypothetical protein
VISTGAIGWVAFKASSQSRSGLRSPAFASSIILCATASRVGTTTPPACWRATSAISKATPRTLQCLHRTCGLASNAGSTWQAVWSEISCRKGKLVDQWRIDAKRVRLSGECVSDISKRGSGIACPRCQTSMQEIMRIAPLRNEPGLIAYECPACEKLTSEIWPAARTTDRSDAP